MGILSGPLSTTAPAGLEGPGPNAARRDIGPERLSVVLEHEREQLSSAKASGDVKEMLQEQRCRASMLIVVGNDESHLRTARARIDANELTDGD